ncbi:MAG: hypothetical protein AAF447_08260 [Myxococcota bacterium]
MRTTLSWLIAAALLFSAPSAFAQTDPEAGSGSWGGSTPTDPEAGAQTGSGNPFVEPDAPEEPEAPPGQRAPAAQAAPVAAAPAAPAEHDHVFSVGKIGLTFFGVDSIRLTPNAPLVPGSGTPLTDVSDGAVVRAPVVGVRYWFSESLGLDIGLGIGFRSRDDVNNLFRAADGSVFSDTYDGLDGVFGLAFHAGLPFSLKTYPHFNLLFIPEIGFTYAQATAVAFGPSVNDVDFASIGFQVDARFGGEVSFGFWGLPNLALQATVGIGFAYSQQTAADQRDLGDAGAVDLETTEFGVQTTANDIFNGTIRVLYYF